jgi:hypothetical protein
LISAHQNDWKIQKKKKKFEAKKKKKYLNFFKIAFETQKQSRI